MKKIIFAQVMADNGKSVFSGLFDENGEPIDSTPRAMMKFKIRSDLKFVPGTILRKQNIK